MKLGYQTNTWGGVVGHPNGVTSIKDLYYLANGSTEEALADIAAAGYEGFELFDGNLMAYENEPDRFKSLMRQHGLQFIGVYVGANFIYPDIWKDELYRIERTARLAASLGAEHLVAGGGAIRHDGTTEDDYKRLAAGLDEVTRMAAKYGLTASYHPHLGTIVQAPEQLRKLTELTDVKLCPDTAHIEAGGGDPLETIRTYIDRIEYVHFKDYRNGRFVPLGQGSQKFSAMLDVLKAHQYDGWLTVELDSFPNPKEGAETSMQFLKGIL
ncbi:sugar phosphate isomerase/epimerase family protein [Paenibacillus cisolokensis]|jgi:inosose dehydratase|uniref:sugar phosphate isomerase/epimerase family protein n=1 Tax=Paenibacillus cisolokensis TaxID=1658519 RepID=UPI003D291ABE